LPCPSQGSLTIGAERIPKEVRGSNLAEPRAIAVQVRDIVPLDHTGRQPLPRTP